MILTFSESHSALDKSFSSDDMRNFKGFNAVKILQKTKGLLKNMFSLRSSSYDLRGNYILSLSKPKTTTYGLNSFSYFSAKQWNALPDFFRTSFFADFKTKIQDVTFM